jgi:hypothetical protein
LDEKSKRRLQFLSKKNLKSRHKPFPGYYILQFLYLWGN